MAYCTKASCILGASHPDFLCDTFEVEDKLGERPSVVLLPLLDILQVLLRDPFLSLDLLERFVSCCDQLLLEPGACVLAGLIGKDASFGRLQRVLSRRDSSRLRHDFECLAFGVWLCVPSMVLLSFILITGPF